MKYWLAKQAALAMLALAVMLPTWASAQVIAGRVTDDRTTQPAVDYAVRLMQMGDTGIVVLDETTTDAKGVFSVVAPSAGSYLLTFGKAAPRLQRIALEVEAGVTPSVREFALPIQRESDTRPYVDVDVDTVLRPVPRMPGPMYPEAQRTARQGGSLFAMFVIDTVGRIEKNSVRLFSSTHIDFAKAVELWLDRAAFRPARVGGVTVRQQICMPIVFLPDDAGRLRPKVAMPVIPAAGLASSSRALCTRAVEMNSTMTIAIVK